MIYIIFICRNSIYRRFYTCKTLTGSHWFPTEIPCLCRQPTAFSAFLRHKNWSWHFRNNRTWGCII